MPTKLESETIGMLLTDVSRLLRGAFDRKVNAMDLGITPGEARTLIQVALTEGIKQAEIATRMGIEPMTLSAYLDRLEAMELVARLPDPADRRAKNVVITDKADPLLAELMAGLREMMNAYTEGLDEATRDMLCANLRILRENLRGLDPCVAGKEKGAKP
ncbi:MULTISPECIES: MarR family transcriptional regulator [Ensifer]|jgi:DNA-binding MarR family transcriptional regulator|uniref:MarR family transcriptional regulator n=1 Tax=Ensifer canadensis TaxID=555315 RepID=A0AAW4FQN1_9HYPH|nr:MULTISPECIES: MarR family transcriptional regulator [Ensifer]AHK42757.1 putative transcriptional regulator, MarR family [Ensifer adhaerens OV14]MDP9631963.1 DNA-binding MarR family transcriptional regulator [Ensifer adhaerens]KQU77460.1 MarR family transcriptional regulator [Ensifer sp. Root31]KQW34509.1 MarR family transcriptional regulator [Ensifer sp. Root1252]KQW56297.1 MarR family transcriptional regulator [Ensifer sp. Root127]